MVQIRKAVYAGSFDPITYGHINIIERTACLYDELVIFIAVDYRKNYTFSPEERMNMVEESISHIPNVSVVISKDCYVVKHAESIGAQVVIRGLRNTNDLDSETIMAEENRKICPHIETVWIPCLSNLAHVSSSMVKGHVGIDPGWKKEVSRSTLPIVVSKLNEKYIMGKARKYWASLMLALNSPIESDSIFNNLVNNYTSSNRHHHNLEHIVNMLDDMQMFNDTEIVNRAALQLAIWYHDVVYNVGSENDPSVIGNEERSVKLLKYDSKKLGLTKGLIKIIEELILATKHSNIALNYNTAILLDLDLAVLGKSDEEFDSYENGIRNEYKSVPEKDFCIGRIQILNYFLSRTFIYSTELFRSKYEDNARKNITYAIINLEKKI